MRRRGLATNTINGRIRACQQLFKFLFAEGILDRNLAEGLKPIDENLKYLKNVFEEKGTLLDVRFVTADKLKMHVIGHMLEKELSGYTINGCMKTYRQFLYFWRENDIGKIIYPGKFRWSKPNRS